MGGVCFSDAGGEAFFYVGEAIGDVLGVALDEQFHRVAGQVLYKAGQFVPHCDPMTGVSKANALDSTRENHMFCSISHA